MRTWVLSIATLLAFTAAAVEIKFKKIIIEKQFRSEGVNVADVNKDGKLDVIVGDFWYAAPDWKPSEIRPPQKLQVGGYSESFGVYTDDFNKDGWTDVLVIPFHGKDALWYENPKGAEGHWKQRTAFPKTGNETRLYTDLFNDGKKVFVMGIADQFAWVEVPDDATTAWPVHPVHEGKAQMATLYAHGVGVGDVNADGRNDIITRDGWYEQPAEGRKATLWPLRAAKLGSDCADMYAFDADGDGLNDVICSSAHGRGIWCHQQVAGSNATQFKSQTLHDLIPVTHSLNFVDLNGDGTKELVTGQRPGTHGSKGPTSQLYWFELKMAKGEPLKLVPNMIDEESGIGTQFVTTDMNGDKLLDIVISNKSGVFIFEQQK